MAHTCRSLRRTSRQFVRHPLTGIISFDNQPVTRHTQQGIGDICQLSRQHSIFTLEQVLCQPLAQSRHHQRGRSSPPGDLLAVSARAFRYVQFINPGLVHGYPFGNDGLTGTQTDEMADAALLVRRDNLMQQYDRIFCTSRHARE